AIHEKSLFNIRLQADFNDVKPILFICRSDSTKQVILVR
ncbi:MAG: hypothetical protein ACI9QV_001485, partial [Methylophagaceae bacterium]